MERDYILAHVVAQLHRAVPEDGGRLVFKGGTALRFVHLGEYRYSADLDFTIIDGRTGPAVAAIASSLAAARQHAGLPHLELTGADTTEIAYIGPLGASKPRHIKLDVTADELVESVDHRIIRNLWPDLPAPVTFGVYPLDEIGAEKLRCIIQRVQIAGGDPKNTIARYPGRFIPFLASYRPGGRRPTRPETPSPPRELTPPSGTTARSPTSP